MNKDLTISQAMESNASYSTFQRSAVITVSVFVFLMSISLMGLSIGTLTGETSTVILGAIENPFIGLFIGLLSTALLQSSSTVTSILVAAVAARGINLSDAIPIVMGANIGTTLTSTIVSMGYITKKKEFIRAVSAGTVHDFFNIFMVVLLFPLEMKYHFLESGSHYISTFIGFDQAAVKTGYNPLKFFTLINSWVVDKTGGVVGLVLSVILLFTCLKFISKLLYNTLIGKTKKKFETTVFSNTFKSFGWGLLITSAAQSSSLTTSLIVPLVATGKVKLKRAFQFIMGANLGTTITALLAATFQSEAAISIALVHLLFNALGVILFLLIPFLSKIPVFLAKKMGVFTLRMRIIGFAYILIMFFLLPFTLIYASRGLGKTDTTEIQSER
ncbi:MAG: Na/Pi symporter [Bacteroidota bacterium]